MRKLITKRAVDALKPGEAIADSELPGFVVRRLPSGRLSYGYRYTQDGKRLWLNIGMGLTPADARTAATTRAGEVAKGQNPVSDRAEKRQRALAARTVSQILDSFLTERVRGRLRSAAEMESLLDRFVRPKIGDAPINGLKRSEVVAMLDGIAGRASSRAKDGKSRRVADKVLGVLRSAFNWHAARDDEFRSPIVKGMARTTLKELSRDRILDDEEIRLLWHVLASAKPDAYARLVRMLLLSAARLTEMSALQRGELFGDALTVPASRTKTKLDHTLPITPAMLRLIGTVGEAGDFIFSTNGGDKPFSGFSKAKAQLDKLLEAERAKQSLPPMAPWRLHDLRRTARSLMSRAGVQSDIAERVLGHALPGIRGVYDRHVYLAEKRHALEALGALIEFIAAPPGGKVVPLSRAGKAA